MTLINIKVAYDQKQKTGFTCTQCKKHFNYEPSIIVSKHKALCDYCFENEVDTSSTAQDDIEQVANGLKVNNVNIGGLSYEMDLLPGLE